MRGEIPEGETLWREHLANERTMLSWVRTGLNAIGFGILLHAIARASGVLLHSRHIPAEEISYAGLGLVAMGALIELAALVRFARFRRSIREGHLTGSVALYLLITLGLLLLGVAFVVYAVSS